MKTVGSRLMRRYMAVIHWFIPAHLQHTPALLSRAQNIINAVVMAAVAGPFFACVYYVLGFALPAYPLVDLQTRHFLSAVGLVVLVVGFVLLFEMTRTQGFIKLERALNFINELAIRDELTGVHNRRHLLSLIEVEQARSA